MSGISKRLSTWRASLLLQAFELLYGPLVLFHEPVGRTIFGPSWHGRRRDVLARLRGAWRIIDVGSGAGHLLAEAERLGFDALGVEPSASMRRLASQRGVNTMEGRAQAIPLATGGIDVVVATYPGEWIFDRASWDEIARVLRPDGEVIVLLGGTVERGPGSWARRRLHRLAYGTATDAREHPEIGNLGHPKIPGNVEVQTDVWGQAILWIGRRL